MRGISEGSKGDGSISTPPTKPFGLINAKRGVSWVDSPWFWSVKDWIRDVFGFIIISVTGGEIVRERV